MSKRYRWACETCGKGQLGSSRPPLDSVVRYCLPCSKKTGSLVKRTCPALERKRAAKLQRSAAKRSRKTERTREAETARWVVGRFDLRAEARKLCRLVKIPLPKLERRFRARDYTTGRSWGGRVVLTMPPGVSEHEALALLCHELAHEAADSGHDQRWRSYFIDLCEYYGCRVVGAAASSQDLHELLAGGLREALGGDPKGAQPPRPEDLKNASRPEESSP